MSATECNYKEIDRQLKEQFIHGLNYSDTSIKIIKDLTKIEDRESITSEQKLVCAGRVEAQKMQSTILENLKKQHFQTEYLQKSTKPRWNATMRTKQNACKTKMQILWFPHTHPDNAQFMERCVQHVASSTTTNRYAEVAGTKEYRALTHNWNSTQMKMRLIR